MTGASDVLGSIKTAVLAEHGRLLAEMLQQMQAGLLDAPGAASAPPGLPALLRRLRSNLGHSYRQAISRCFGLQARVGGGSLDRELGRYAASPEEAFREDQTLSAIEQAAMLRNSDQHRLCCDRLRQCSTAGLGFNPAALSPASALQAFRLSLETFNLDLPERLYLYERFDRWVIGGLDGVYAAVLAVLDAQPMLDGGSHPSSAGAEMLVDASMHQSIQAVSDGLVAVADRDRRLATELLASLSRHPAGAMSQRLGLCGLLLKSGAGSSPRLRWSLAKIALADSGVFERSSHPVRLVLRDWGALSPKGPAADAERRGVEQRLQQLEISADFVTPLLLRLTALSPAAADRFVEQLQQQERGVRESRLALARRAVARTLDRCTLGMVRPAGLRLFLRAGWGPLLTQRHLQGAGESESWREAVRQLEQLLAMLADPSTRVREFEQQVNRAGAVLFAGGAHADRVERLLQSLREAYDELHVGPAGGVSNTALRISEWFQPGNGSIDLEADTQQAVVEPLIGSKPRESVGLSGAGDAGPDLELFPV